jgi:hypothetical protein
MWRLYFLLGFILAGYVFYVFLGSLHTLFEHDEIGRASQSSPPGSSAANQEDRS